MSRTLRRLAPLIFAVFALLLTALPTPAGAEDGSGYDPALDRDKDWLIDDDEVVLGTDPGLFDTDGDLIGDGDEALTHGTDPLKMDTDDDGYSESDELSGGSDPLDPSSIPGSLPVGDLDGDGLSDPEEAAAGTDPTDPDSDDDGLPDLDEVVRLGTNPLAADSDGDGYADPDELIEQTDPLDPTNYPTDAVGTITVLARICPDGAEDQIRLYYCAEPAAGVLLEMASTEPAVASTAAVEIDANGYAVISDLPVGAYLLTLGVPGDFATFDASCGVGEAEAYSPRANSQTNQIDVSIVRTGEDVICTWFVIPADAGAEPDPVDGGDPTPPPSDPTDPDPAPVDPTAPTKGPQPVTALPNTGAGSAAHNGAVWLVVALGAAGLAGLVSARTLASRRHA
jgi:hypothetical protein